MIITDFGDLIAERMRVEHRALAARWFDRLLDLLPVDAREVFPTESLLDHVPSLILEISTYLADPEEGAIAANTADPRQGARARRAPVLPARLAAPAPARVPAAQRHPGHVRPGGDRAARHPAAGGSDSPRRLPAARRDERALAVDRGVVRHALHADDRRTVPAARTVHAHGGARVASAAWRAPGRRQSAERGKAGSQLGRSARWTRWAGA